MTALEKSDRHGYYGGFRVSGLGFRISTLMNGESYGQENGKWNACWDYARANRVDTKNPAWP